MCFMLARVVAQVAWFCCLLVTKSGGPEQVPGGSPPLGICAFHEQLACVCFCQPSACRLVHRTLHSTTHRTHDHTSEHVVAEHAEVTTHWTWQATFAYLREASRCTLSVFPSLSVAHPLRRAKCTTYVVFFLYCSLRICIFRCLL